MGITLVISLFPSLIVRLSLRFLTSAYTARLRKWGRCLLCWFILDELCLRQGHAWHRLWRFLLVKAKENLGFGAAGWENESDRSLEGNQMTSFSKKKWKWSDNNPLIRIEWRIRQTSLNSESKFLKAATIRAGKWFCTGLAWHVTFCTSEQTASLWKNLTAETDPPRRVPNSLTKQTIAADAEWDGQSRRKKRQ